MRQAIGAEPDAPGAYAMLAVCRSMLGDHKAARQAAERSIELGPDLPMGHLSLAMVIYNSQTLVAKKKALAEARAAVGEALRLDPDDARAHHLAGLILRRMGRDEEALAEAELGLRCDPEDTECAVLRAELLRRLGRLGDAHEQSRQALSLAPEAAEAHTSHGWTLLRTGSARPAAYHFREALRLEPNSESARAGFHHAVEAMNPVFRFFTRMNMALDDMRPGKRWLVVGGPTALIAATAVLFSDVEHVPGLLMLGFVVAMLIAAVAYAFLGGAGRGGK